MNVSNTNLLNSLVLIFMGFWGFLELSSPTALIPAFFGAILLICYLITKFKPSLNKLFAHIAVTFTILILISLVVVRLPKSIDDGGIGLLRVISMISTSSLALIIFIKSFVDARFKSK
tara:strand:- start:2451 stop:2804 length:354 start_codon:yes stop_codon:yes gene_type:complete